MCMYTYLVYVYVYMYIHIHLYAYIDMYIYIYMHMYICIYISSTDRGKIHDDAVGDMPTRHARCLEGDLGGRSDTRGNAGGEAPTRRESRAKSHTSV